MVLIFVRRGPPDTPENTPDFDQNSPPFAADRNLVVDTADRCLQHVLRLQLWPDIIPDRPQMQGLAAVGRLTAVVRAIIGRLRLPLRLDPVRPASYSAASSSSARIACASLILIQWRDSGPPGFVGRLGSSWC